MYGVNTGFIFLCDYLVELCADNVTATLKLLTALPGSFQKTKWQLIPR